MLFDRFLRIRPRACLVVLLLVLTAPGARAQEQAPADPKQVIGGEASAPGEFPFLVAIMDRFFFDIFGAFLAQFCGGTLVGPQWVLTAAHCVNGVNEADLLVLVGRGDLNGDGGEVIAVKEIIVHPDFEAGALRNDIALIRLGRLTQSPAVGFLEVPDDARAAPGVQAKIAGWGARSWDPDNGAGDFPATVHDASVPIVTNQQCAEAYESITGIDDSHICAGLLGEGGVDTCGGDSGGPMLVDDGQGGFIQAGITSFAEGCAQADFPGVYTRVSTFAQWISENAVDRMHFAQFADGVGITSDVVVVNPSPTHTLSGRLRIWGVGGEEIPAESVLSAASPPPAFELPPRGVITFSSTGQGELVLGSAVVSSDVPAGGVLRFAIPNLGVAGVGVGLVGTAFITPVRREGTVSTGVAVRNTGREAVKVTFELKNAGGEQIPGGSVEIEIPGEGRLAIFIQELFPDLDTENFRGSLCVQSDGGQLAALALELGGPGEFTTLPVSAVP